MQLRQEAAETHGQQKGGDADKAGLHANYKSIWDVAAVYCFEHPPSLKLRRTGKIAKSRWDFIIKGKNRACLEIWCEPTPVASFPLRPSVKMAWGTLGAPGGRAPP